MAHPDELSTVAFYAPTIHWPKDWSTALDPQRSPLNPLWDLNTGRRRSYTYGHFPLYLLVITSNLAHSLAPLAERLGASPGIVQALAEANKVPSLALVGRFLMALADTATVYLVYLIALRLYGRGAGLLAAAFSAFTVIQIQLAHFFAIDPLSATFTLLALYGAILMVERPSSQMAVLTGLGAGLATASKFSALPILAAPAVAVLILLFRRRFALAEAIHLVGIALLVALIAFSVTSPFAILDWGNFVRAVIVEQGAMVRGVADFPFTRQYRGTTPYLYHIVQQLRWGMGWPLGIVAFTGLGWVLARALLRRAQPGELALLSWIVPYFGITGLFLAKFMRYMVPVVPLFVLMGAGMLCKLQVTSDKRRVRYLLIALTLGGAIFWSLAFVNGVYNTEHTWITASRWIYTHVPDGSVLCLEHWDRSLPLSLLEPGANIGAHGYRTVELPMYDEDNGGKYQLLRSRLRECDYVILASKRLYRSIPRLPQRYPMSIKYYDLLFSGQLGFEKVAEFATYPRLGPFVFCDDDADESFIVYDHPKPIIFRKVRELSDREWDKLLGESWIGAIPGYVGEPTLLARLWGGRPSPPPSERAEKRGLLLDVPVDELPVVDDFRWNELANRHHPLAVAFWWLALEVIGFATWPLTFIVFCNLRDRGYILAKSLGLLIVAYLVWLPASLRLLRNAFPTHLLALGFLSLLSFHLFRRRRGEMAAFWREKRLLIALNEALFASSFLLFVGIRVLNPDLWQPWMGGEKMMEMAFLNACLKSAHFPPYDPYFAGGYINYYYYGQFLISVLIKLTGITPSVAFNLAVPALFALTVGNAFCVGYNLSRGAGEQGGRGAGKLVGLLAAASVVVLGNLDGMAQVVGRLMEGGLRRAVLPFDYWSPTRVIPYTINEFPFFSFLFADLHPHMIDMPFTILVIALALNVWKRETKSRRPAFSFHLLAISFCLGALAVINTWDLPAYFVLLTAALLICQRLTAFLISLFSFLFSLLLYWPFFAHYKAFHVGIGLVRDRTGLGNFLDIWGFFLFLALSFLIIELLRRRSKLGILRLLRLSLGRWRGLPHLVELHRALVRRPTLGYVLGLCALGAMAALAFGLASLGEWVLALLLPFTALAVLLWEAEPREHFALLLIALGLSLLLGCELVYLKDFLAGSDHYRMNTVFKFHIQAWVLLGIGAAAALPQIWARLGRWRSRWRWVWKGTSALLLLCSLVYPLLGTPARVADRFPGARPPIGTLDGMAYMRVGSYTWPEGNRIELKYDYLAIRWLLENVKGTPVIAEAAIGYYREGGLRVSSYTGFPTLLGMHQSEQRYGWQVGERDGKTKELFNTTYLARARRLIGELNVSYIYIGQLERAVYDPAGLAKFDRMAKEGDLGLVYQNERVKIYKVKYPRKNKRVFRDGQA